MARGRIVPDPFSDAASTKRPAGAGCGCSGASAAGGGASKKRAAIPPPYVGIADNDIGDRPDVVERDPCESYVAIAPNVREAEQYVDFSYDEELDLEVSWPCGDDELMVDGTSAANWQDEFAAGGDPANDINSFVSLRCPADLRAAWNTRFTFDDPNFFWVYARVGDTSANLCSLPTPLNEAGGSSYVVSALRPYAAYMVLGETDHSSEGFYRLRIRYWVGVMHHFSFFVPPADYANYFDTRSGIRMRRYGTSALSAAYWDEPAGKVNPRGTFVQYWTSLVREARFQARWSTDFGFEYYADARYSCDPTEHVLGGSYGNSYSARGGTASPLCYDDPAALATAGEMAAFLGICRTSEVCVCVSTKARLLNLGYEKKAVEEGFEMLYGDAACLGYNLAWYTPEATAGSTRDPSFIRRSFRVDAGALEDVRTLIAKQDALRTNKETRYLYREWDPRRLEKAYVYARLYGKECK